MSATTALRSIAKHSRALSRTVQVASASQPARAFHSPFTLLSTPDTSPITSPPAPTSTVSPIYEVDEGAHPTTYPTLSTTSHRVYVVSEPDPRSTPYDVPYGAFPTYAPYVPYPTTPAPTTTPRSSTSSSLAHPWTTRAVPQNPSGVSESAAVRFAEAPGEMGARGGSDGGLGLMDAATTTPGEAGELPEVNPQPDAPGVAERFSAMGVDHAWKARK